MSRTALVLLAGVLVPFAGAWLTTSQARYGAELDEIQKSFNAESQKSADRSLGWLWSAPNDARSTRGLGGSITWAWDPALCTYLMSAFKEEFFNIRIIDCSSVRAAMHRAFDTWAQNHPRIFFTEVTDLCEENDVLDASCPHAEVWVTYRNASNSPGLKSVVAAVAIPKYAIRSDFTFTSGMQPTVKISDSLTIQKQMIEVIGGRIEFEFERPMCWYLDSNFCAAFHRLKRMSSPSTIKAIGAVLLFGIWTASAVATIVRFLWSIRKQLKLRAKVLVDRDGDGTVEAHEVLLQAAENVSLRIQAFLAALAHDSIVRTTLQICLFFIPWPFYLAVFEVCWDCYDFEAAAAHEVGHLLGLGHPDKLPGSELQPGYPMPNGTYYNDWLLSKYPTNSSYCQHPWDSVMAGVPPEFNPKELVGGGQVRPAIMESLTTHNPSVCLFQDDYDALMTLYPVCTDMPHTPRCEKSARNLGLLRVAMFVVGPLVMSLVLSIMLHSLVDRQRRKWYMQKQVARAKLQAAEIAAQSDPNEENNAAAAIQARIRGRNSRVTGKVAPMDAGADPASPGGVADSGAGAVTPQHDPSTPLPPPQKRGEAEVMSMEDEAKEPRRVVEL